MSFEEALRSLEITEANLRRLETLVGRLRQELGQVETWGTQAASAFTYRRLRQDYLEFISQLPAIDGWRITATPPDIDAPATGPRRTVTEDVKEYRARFEATRRRVIGPRVQELIDETDSIIGALNPLLNKTGKVSGPEWTALKQNVEEINRLLGNRLRSGHWNQLTQHLYFGLGQDLDDIQKTDWPGVRRALVDLMHEDRAIPVPVADLAALSGARGTSSPVSTHLHWSMLDADGFERLLFALWEPPAIDVLVFATSGRFSEPAVRLIEQHNVAGKRPK